MIKYLLYIFVAMLLWSCKDEYTLCDLPNIVRMKCRLYRNVGGTESETTVPLLTVIRIPTSYPDYNSPGISSFSLALNPIADSLQYRVSINGTSIPDTVTFVYTSTKVTLSPVCGDVYIHNLTRVNTTVNTLDSIKISDNTINTTSGENVRIYF